MANAAKVWVGHDHIDTSTLYDYVSCNRQLCSGMGTSTQHCCKRLERFFWMQSWSRWRTMNHLSQNDADQTFKHVTQPLHIAGRRFVQCLRFHSVQRSPSFAAMSKAGSQPERLTFHALSYCERQATIVEIPDHGTLNLLASKPGPCSPLHACKP